MMEVFSWDSFYKGVIGVLVFIGIGVVVVM